MTTPDRSGTPYPRTGAVPQDRVAPPDLPTPTPIYHPQHRPVRVLGGLVVLGMVGAGLVGTVPEMVRDAQTEHIALGSATGELTMRAGQGDMTVREVGAGEEPGITAEKHWSFIEPEVHVETEGGVTSAWLECPGISNVGQCYASWTVLVPVGTDVELRPGVGDVEVTGLTGAVTVNGSVGDVHVDGSPSSLDVNTSVGEVTAVLREPAEQVSLRSSVGDITLTLPGGVAYDVSAAGIEPADVRVETDPASEYAVDVHTSVGAVLITHG